MSTTVEHRSVKAWAEVEDLGEIEITELQVTYGINQIPRGSVTLALGRNAQTGAVASIHGQAEELHMKKTAKVYLKIGGETKLVFDGFTSGAPYQRDYSTAAFSIGLVGWLDDLMNSSAMSDIFAVGTPSDFFASSSSEISGVTLFASTAAGDVLTTFNVSADIWDATKRATIIMCEKGLLKRLGSTAAGVGGGTRPLDTLANDAAVAALNRFDGDVLSMTVVSNRMKAAVALNLGDIIFGPGGGDTVWSKLMALVNLYGFSIIPRVSSAKAAAYVPFLKSTVIPDANIIHANEYGTLNRAAYSRDQIRGAVLLGGGHSITNVIDGTAKLQSDILTKYIVGEVGQLFVGTAPQWLTAEVAAETWTPKTTGEGASGIRATGGATAGATTVTENEDFNEMQLVETIGQKYAQYTYLANVLSGRQVTITGKVRFDICPGSPVAVEVAGKDLYGSEYLYGSVESVTLRASTNAPNVSTSFMIGSYHVASEDDLAADSHPLYGEPYLGDTLTE